MERPEERKGGPRRILIAAGWSVDFQRAFKDVSGIGGGERG